MLAYCILAYSLSLSFYAHTLNTILTQGVLSYLYLSGSSQVSFMALQRPLYKLAPTWKYETKVN